MKEIYRECPRCNGEMYVDIKNKYFVSSSYSTGQKLLGSYIPKCKNEQCHLQGPESHSEKEAIDWINKQKPVIDVEILYDVVKYCKNSNLCKPAECEYKSFCDVIRVLFHISPKDIDIDAMSSVFNLTERKSYHGYPEIQY